MTAYRASALQKTTCKHAKRPSVVWELWTGDRQSIFHVYYEDHDHPVEGQDNNADDLQEYGVRQIVCHTGRGTNVKDFER